MSQSSIECDHIGKIVSWTVSPAPESRLVPQLYGCTLCDETSDVPLPYSSNESYHSHTEYVYGCFACKVRTLQLNTGDANGNLISSGWTNKKWDNELQLYRDARAQGIQPSGTTTAKIQRAMDISDGAGKAFDASSPTKFAE